MEFVCSVWISEQIANFALEDLKKLVFITEVESVYCAVRTDYLYNTDMFRPSKVNITYEHLILRHSLVIVHNRGWQEIKICGQRELNCVVSTDN
jgi:hypothetical protein